MKKIGITILLGILSVTYCFSQTKADDIIGYYLTLDPKSKEKNQMEIYKTEDGKYEAKVVWVENKEKIPLVGTVPIRNLTFDPKNKEWKNGKVKYDGNDYSLTISISEPGKLKLRGYMGISLLGKTIYWTKENELRK